MSIFDDTTKVPGANYNAQYTPEDLVFEQEVYSEEFLQRMWLMFGGFTTSPEYGIVDESDPQNISEEEVNRPLQVLLDGTDALRVNPGMTVLASGVVLKVKQSVIGITVSDLPTSCSYVVFAEYELQETDEALVVRYGNQFSARKLKAPTSEQAIKVDLLTNFLEQTKYTTARRRNITALALAEVSSDCDGDTQITIKHSDPNYTFLRPWFSVVDHAHRAQKNPHGTTLNDLAIDGDTSLWNLIARHGLIIAADSSSPGQPGKLCEESLVANGPAEIKLDETGEITGKLNRLYADLTSYPVRLGRCTSPVDDEHTTTYSAIHSALAQEAAGYFGIGPSLVPHTNRILFSWDEFNTIDGTALDPGDSWYEDDDLNIRYLRVESLEPPTPVAVANKTKATFGTLDTTRDHVIASGKNITEMESYIVDCADLSPLPVPVMVYAISDSSNVGQLVKAPHVLVPSTKMSDAEAAINVEATFLGASRVWVGFHGITAGGGSLGNTEDNAIKVTITGTDVDNAAVTVYVYITGNRVTAYKSLACDESDTCALEPTSSVRSSDVNGLAVQGRLTDWQSRFIDAGTLFTSVSSVQVNLQSNSPGANSSILVLAVPSPQIKNDSNMFGTVSASLKGACPVAMLLWDGVGICGVRDYRPICVEPTKVEGRAFSDMMIQAQASTTYPSFNEINAEASPEESAKVGWHLVMAEDFRSPWFCDLEHSRFTNQYVDGLDWFFPHPQVLSSSESFIGQGTYVSRSVSLPQYMPPIAGATPNRVKHTYFILRLLGEQTLNQNMWVAHTGGLEDAVAQSSDLVLEETAVPVHIEYLAADSSGSSFTASVKVTRKRDYLYLRVDSSDTYSAVRARVIVNIPHLITFARITVGRIRGFVLYTAYVAAEE